MNHHFRMICAAAAVMLCIVVPALAGPEAGIAGVSSSGYSVAFNQAAVPMEITPPGAGDVQAGNFSKLLVSPQYLSYRLEPGESKELTFTVTNKGSDPVDLTPRFTEIPYGGPYTLDSSWIRITPAEAKVGPGEKAKFTLTMTVPADATRGYYSGQVALTNEQYPSPYPGAYPNFVQVVSISTEVVAPPAISITPAIIGGSLEAGKSYDYQVILNNNQDVPLSIHPDLEGGMYLLPVPAGSTGAATLTDDAFTLSVPGTIPAHGEVTLHVHVDIPADAAGYYNGMINLGIDDPSVQAGEGMVQVSFMVWKQPATPFAYSFVMKEEGPLTIELSASRDPYGYAMPTGYAAGTQADPFFDLAVNGPEGMVTPVLVKTVIKGSVDLSSTGNPYVSATDTRPYQESGVQYISTYVMAGKAGTWDLAIMPHNVARFDYIITMGAAGDLAITPAVPATRVPATTTPGTTATTIGTNADLPGENATESGLNQT